MGLGSGEAVQTYNVNLINTNMILTVNYPNKMNTISIDLGTTTNDSKWYAVYTRPRWEKKVAEILAQKKIENYCPLNRVIRQWSDRKKVVLEPLFTSYVFVKTTQQHHADIRKITGILNFVYWLNKPATIRNEEIDNIREFLNEHMNVQIQKAPVSINDAVKVIKGPLMDYEGNVIAIKSKTLKILLPSLGYMMIAEVEKTSIKIINNEESYKVNYNIAN
jgi:transcription antitermination factor NusG